MPKNRVFLAILSMIGLAALFFSVKSGIELYTLWRLDAYAPLEKLEFTPKPLAEDKFVLVAKYDFLNQTQEEVIKEPTYLNPFGAETAAKKLSQELKGVWYNSNNPSLSTLQKNTPYKQWAYTMVLWGLFAYFIILNRMVHGDYAKK